MRLKSVVAATVVAGVIAVIPMLAQGMNPSLQTILDNAKLLQSAPFHTARG